MKKIIVYYDYDGDNVGKMTLNLEDSEAANLKEIFYDSCPDDNPKIVLIKEE